ncbi:hypothetical protein NDU88_000243 [Pleurodeles waltl]|uniref:glutathione transferase n=1 Tax=Pleurodeles waltl TaxID=8319 RepID=A0AAV7SVZ0_PLEWA|nr:hypothetical protein NDU88_000243 [Pleurodeles waltl]
MLKSAAAQEGDVETLVSAEEHSYPGERGVETLVSAEEHSCPGERGVDTLGLDGSESRCSAHLETTMTQYTITYFNIHGRSGAMRYLLADQGCEWKEDKFSFQDWNDGKVELKKTAVSIYEEGFGSYHASRYGESLSQGSAHCSQCIDCFFILLLFQIFGQLPMFADGDFILFQSNAILRYLGRKHDLYGKNNKEAALIDMANDGMEDLREKIYKCLTQEWKTNKEKYLEELPNHLRNFERLLSQSSSGFIIGSTVSFADYNLLDILLFHLFIAPDCLNSFPRLKAFKEKMESRPKLKAFLQSNEHKNRPFLPENML